jgi:regulator of RNase E activity RraA
MVGHAVTLVIEPSNPTHRQSLPHAWDDYRRSLAAVPGPKIVCVQDLDKPRVVGSFWGEVNASVHRALGCVGTIVDGAIRDVDEMTGVGFKALARRLCVGHAHVQPVRWGCPVEVFGRTVHPGDLIHADKHGFLVITAEEAAQVLEAALFMDANECRTVIPAARDSAGQDTEAILAALSDASGRFATAARTRFGRRGEWDTAPGQGAPTDRPASGGSR